MDAQDANLWTPKIEPWQWIVEKLQSWKNATSIVVLKISFDSPPRSEKVKPV